MTKFKKILLNISILTAINIFSINCFAMKNEDNKKFSISSITTNKEKSKNLSNNDYVYNPFYEEIKNKDDREKNLEKQKFNEPNIKNNEEKSKNLSNNDYIYNPFYSGNSLNSENFLNKKRNLENTTNEKPTTKNNENKIETKERKNEEKKEPNNIINNQIKENSMKENFENNKKESYDELNGDYLIQNIKKKEENLKNVIDNIKNQKNNLFIFFKHYFNTNIAKKIQPTKMQICREILSYLIDKKMAIKQNWNSYLNKHLLKDLFKKYADKNSFIIGFYVSLKDNFILPIFDGSKEENAQNILETFTKIFEDSKAKIIKTCSTDEDTINLMENEFSEVINEIFNFFEENMLTPFDDWWEGDNNYSKFKTDIFEKIKKIKENLKKDQINLKDGIKEIHNHISNFLNEGKENIDNLKREIEPDDALYLENLNKKMLNIFTYKDELEELKKGFNNIKNEYKDFITGYSKNDLDDENKKIFDRTLNSLTLKELQEVINNSYINIDVRHIDSNSENINYIDKISPVKFVFNSELDMLPENDNYLIREIYDNELKIIKKILNENSCNKTYILDVPNIDTDKTNKTSNFSFNLLKPQDAYLVLFFLGKAAWPFKDIIDLCITPELEKEIPKCYATNLLDTYKKIIKDKKIDIKTLDIDKFLEEAKNYPLNEYSNKIISNNTYDIKTDEEKIFDEKLHNKLEEKYSSKNKNTIRCTKNNFICAYVGFQIDFMMETFAKNLKNRYSKLIEESLTIPGIYYSEGDYKITESDKGIANLLGETPQENYIFNYKLLLKNNLFIIKDYIEKVFKNDLIKNIILERAVEDTTKELKEMPELEFSVKFKNHFEKNKENIEKYIYQKNLSDDKKNNYRNNLKDLINATKKKNLNIDYLKNWMEIYKCYILFNIEKF